LIFQIAQVDDGSTAALMEQMYIHLVEGLTVPQSLRLAMLYLARRPDRQDTPRQDAPYKDPSGLQLCDEDVETICSDLKDQIGTSGPIQSELHGEDASEAMLSDVQPFIDMVLGVQHSNTTRGGGRADVTHAMYQDQQELDRDSDEQDTNASLSVDQVQELQMQAHQLFQPKIQQLQMQAQQDFLQRIQQLQAQAQDHFQQKIQQLQVEAQQIFQQNIEHLQVQALQHFQQQIQQFQTQKQHSQQQHHLHMQARQFFQMQAQQHDQQYYVFQMQQIQQIQQQQYGKGGQVCL